MKASLKEIYAIFLLIEEEKSHLSRLSLFLKLMLNFDEAVNGPISPLCFNFRAEESGPPLLLTVFSIVVLNDCVL